MRRFPAPPVPMTLLAFLAASMALPGTVMAQSQAPTYVTGTAEVRDGDTLSLGPVSIRLHGIDGPEGSQRCARPPPAGSGPAEPSPRRGSTSSPVGGR